MERIETLEELRMNGKTLSKYLHNGTDNEKEFAKELIKKGKDFVVFETESGAEFYPSRFLGYKNNNMTEHNFGRI